MRIHHLNCISSCPLGGALMDGRSGLALRGRLACHCLLIEGTQQLILIDTGFGLRDCVAPRTRLSKVFLALTSPEFREEMTAIRQVSALGYDPRDVRHIVLSHLDFDHAGGLDDFSWATVHMLRTERDAALARSTMLDRMRYRPQQWSTTRRHWMVYDEARGERWFGFDAVRELQGIPPEILMVPLPGHTLGHAGIAVRRRTDWLFYAADAYFYHAEMDLAHPRCTPGLRAYQTLMEKDRSMRLHNQQRVRELKRAHGAEVQIFSAHDTREFEALSGHSLHEPAHEGDEVRFASAPH